MATHPGLGLRPGSSRLLLELAGRGPFYPRAAEPVRLQEAITQGVPQPQAIVSSVSLSKESQLVALSRGLGLPSRQMAGDTCCGDPSLEGPGLQ